MVGAYLHDRDSGAARRSSWVLPGRARWRWSRNKGWMAWIEDAALGMMSGGGSLDRRSQGQRTRAGGCTLWGAASVMSSRNISSAECGTYGIWHSKHG
jgi:hypothetical protein